MIRTACAFLLALLLLIVGCGGGGSSTPVPDPVALPALVIDGILGVDVLAPGTPGYAGAELKIEVLVSRGAPASVVWDFGGGAIPFDFTDPQAPVVELGVPGQYVGRVTVANSEGLETSLEFAYAVRSETDRIQEMSPAGLAGHVGETTIFKSTIDGEVEIKRWIFSGGVEELQPEEGAPIVHFTEAGSFTAELQVTIKQGPTIAKTVEFTVLPVPWTELRSERNHEPLAVTVQPNGEIVLLSRNDWVEGTPLECYRLQLEQDGRPRQWAIMTVPLIDKVLDAHIVSNGERFGILALTLKGTGYGGNGPNDWRAYFVHSDSLEPDTSLDWNFQQRIGPYDEVTAIALSDTVGGGWGCLIGVADELVWAANGQSVPAADGWVMGFVPDARGGRDAELVRLADGLVAAYPGDNESRARAANPADMSALLAATPYDLEGTAGGFRTNGERIACLLTHGNDGAMSVLVASQAVPLSLSAWQTVPLNATDEELGNPQWQLGQTSIQLVRTRINTIGQRFIQSLWLDEFPLQAGEFDPTSHWIDEDQATGTFLIAASPAPVLIWLDRRILGDAHTRWVWFHNNEH